jgi:hypothetical protein
LAEIDPGRCPANAAGIGNGDKGPQVTQVHLTDLEYGSIMRPQMHWTNQVPTRYSFAAYCARQPVQCRLRTEEASSCN